MTKIMFTYRRLIDSCRQFCADSRGASLPMVALILVPTLGFIGLSVDAGRGYMVKSRLGDALDAAALAGAQVVHDQAQFNHDVDMFFYANFPDGYMGATPVLIKPPVDADTPTITLTASATIGTTFTKFLGYESMAVAASTEVTRLVTSMDVVIAIDMSGSMGKNGKLDAAKDAAKEMVEILFGSDATKQFLQIGLVPWNGKVNITEDDVNFVDSTPQGGGLHLANNSPVLLTEVPPSNWRGCVYSRYTDNGFDDDADDRLGAARVGTVDWPGAWEPVGSESEPGSQVTCQGSGSSRKCPCLKNGITRLTKVKDDVNAAINDLTTPAGTTNIAAGLAWAWRVLMPGAPFDDGVAVPKGPHTRAIVLLTDGESQARPSDAYHGQFYDRYEKAEPNPGIDDRLREIAKAIKAQGVEIYTIQYDADTDDLEKLMQEVASAPAAPYWHKADSDLSLKDVFEEVGNHLSDLRLSK